MSKNKLVSIRKVNPGCYPSTLVCDDYRRLFEDNGYALTDKIEDAAIILVHTCIVGFDMHDGSHKTIAGALKRKNKNARLVIGGCLTPQIKQNLAGKYGCPVFSSTQMGELAAYLGLQTMGPRLDSRAGMPMELFHGQVGKWKTIWVFMNAGAKLAGFILPPLGHLAGRFVNTTLAYSPRTYWVRCARGCANACSYCIVRQAIGPVVSRDVSDIGEEISAAVQKGYEHFILVADNLNSYGKDKNITYIQLLDAVFKLDGRITVSLNNFSPVSSLPELERFLNILKPGKIKCINYSLQSGSDRLLKAMNRGYTRELFLSSARAILKRDPGISLRSDIMIGFPGETDEDFSQTLAMIQKVPFETINALLYNERPGTKASGLAGKVSEEVKRQRYRKITRAFHARTFKRWVNYFFKRDCLMLD